MKKHVNMNITGRVQGVGFRRNTWKKAQELSIKGFVQNNVDGSVYAEAEAEEDSLNKFVIWCKKGPFGARVDNLIISVSNIQGFKRFDIR